MQGDLLGRRPWGDWAAAGVGVGSRVYLLIISYKKTASPDTFLGTAPTLLPSSCHPDHDECQDMACENGECVNTEGSFHCFCSPPLTLDLSQQRCVNSTSGLGQWAGRGWGQGPRGGWVDLGWRGSQASVLCATRGPA